MRVRVLGCSGGCAPGKAPSCYLLDRGVAVDAGALATSLTIEEQRAVEHVFLTHAHWDHVRDLPISVINRTMETPTLQIYGLPDTVEDMRTHLMNDRVWFSAFDLPTPASPFIAATPMNAGETRECNGYRITGISMPHTVPAIGYLIDDGSDSVIISADTGGGGIFADLPQDISPLRAVFLETSFPNAMREFADLTGHLTAEMLGEEVACLPDEVEIIATHMKPGFEEQITAELMALGRTHLRAAKDGDVFEF